MRMRGSSNLALGLALSLLLAGCSGSAKPSPAPSQPASQPATAAAPVKDLGTLKVAGELRTYEFTFGGNDWGKPYGIKYALSFGASAAEGSQALASGQVEIGFISPSRLIPLISKEPNKYVIVGITSWGAQRASIVVPVSSSITSLEQLKGKKLAASIGTGNWTSLNMYVDQHKWNIKEFNVVNMNVTDMAAALKQSLVDGALMWEPYTAMAELGGQGKPIMNFKGYGTLSNQIVTTRDFAAKSPDKLIAFMAAWYAASRSMTDQPAVAAKYASAFQEKQTGVKVDPKVHELTLQRVYVDEDDMLTKKQLFQDELNETAAELASKKTITAAPDLSKIYDTSYLEKAIALYKSTPHS